jgi:lysozyme
MNQPSQRLLELIASFEAFKDTAYICPGGSWTLGFGSTQNPETGKPVQRGETVTRDKAWKWLTDEVGALRDDVTGMIAWEAPEHVVDACTSFAYNVGIAGFAGSTALKKLNAGDREGAATALKWWNKATDPKTGTKRVLGGLTARREAEADLLLNGWDGTSGGVPVGITENKPTMAGSRSVWALIVTIGGSLIPVLAVALPEVVENARGVSDQVQLAASPKDIMIAAAVPILGALYGLWAKRDDLRKGSFGSQGR